MESLGRDLHTVLSRETLGAGLDLADADTLQVGHAGRAGVHAIRQATARRFAVSAAAASNGIDGARGGIALVAGATVAVAAALALVGINAAIEAAGRGLSAVELALLFVQVVKLTLEGVHIDLVGSGQHGADFGAALCDFLTSFFKHGSFLLSFVSM